MKGLIIMKPKECDQIVVFDNIKQKLITQKKASFILKISYRQVKRKYKRYLIEGPMGLIHKSRGKHSNNTTHQSIKVKVLKLLQGPLKGFGPTFAQEKLVELYNINQSIEFIRQIMISNELWKVKKKRIKKHFWRERKHCEGELIQLDGSKHLWFNNEYYTLIAFIDDATSKIMYAHFTSEETIKDVGLSTKEYLKLHGRPLKIYTDRGKVYKVNNGVNKGITQYQRMLKELDIELIHAYSPQAKGRVERFFKTSQDRLAKELKLNKITDIEAANKYLKEVYIPKHNAKFATIAQNSVNVHRSIENYDINSIFSMKIVRILKADNTIVYKNRWFQLLNKQPVVLRKNQKITMIIDFDKTIKLQAKGSFLNFQEISKQAISKQKKVEKRVKDRMPYKPSPFHPWKNRSKPEVKRDISTLDKRGHF